MENSKIVTNNKNSELMSDNSVSNQLFCGTCVFLKDWLPSQSQQTCFCPMTLQEEVGWAGGRCSLEEMKTEGG